MDPLRIDLSLETSLVYVLQKSGCRGRLTIGHVERLPGAALDVYDQYGSLIGYLSGNALRSWCVLDKAGIPVQGWIDVMPDDILVVLSHSRGPVDGTD